ncbi:MAG TPA: heme ABC exporter ATP-binding protein CcmA, partial [Actinomycetota bacterium]|nr:heme ABC exporter ATP-binding protein CcmA [Actinomycetota bacterium]
MIRFDDVTVAFGKTLALDSVDVEIGAGVTGVFGPNGSGKSTLLRAIAGLVTPLRGEVTIDGRSTRTSTPEDRARLGYSGHTSGLYPRLTVEENLVLFSRLFDAPTERVEMLIEALDLTRAAGTRAASLSAGQKRRASVARALLHDPDLLLLDEPYANVDDAGSDSISSAIAAWAQPGRT